MHHPVADDDDAKKLLKDLLEGPLGDEPAASTEEEEGAEEPAEDPAEAQRAAELAGASEVGHYQGPYATPDERAKLGRDRNLVGKLMALAHKRGLRRADAEDVVQETLASASLAAQLPGGSGEARTKYVCGVLGYKITEFWRKTYKDKELTERAADYFHKQVTTADRVADRDLLVKLPWLVKPKQREDLRSLIQFKLENRNLRVIALERGEDYDAFAKRIKRLWRTLQTTVGAMAAVLLFLLLRPRPGHPLGYDEPYSIPVPDAAVSTHIGQLDPIDRAKLLRSEAFRACMNNQWKQCLDGLAAASELDPDGDRDPAVVAAKVDAGNGITNKGDWKPPVVRAYADRAAR